jgi:hypothetical protein
MSIDALAVCPMKGTAFPSAEVEVFVDGFFAAPLPLLMAKRSAMRKSSFLIAERTLACSW